MIGEAPRAGGAVPRPSLATATPEHSEASSGDPTQDALFRDGCTERVRMTVAEYQHVRADNDRFALVLGHETPEMEAVVESNERFVVVDKLPEAEPLVGADGQPRSGS